MDTYTVNVMIIHPAAIDASSFNNLCAYDVHLCGCLFFRRVARWIFHLIYCFSGLVTSAI